MGEESRAAKSKGNDKTKLQWWKWTFMKSEQAAFTRKGNSSRGGRKNNSKKHKAKKKKKVQGRQRGLKCQSRQQIFCLLFGWRGGRD